jgi:hypothetical protein
MPTPAEQMTRQTQGSENNPAKAYAYERLIRKEIIHDSPEVMDSLDGVVYTTHMRLTYGMSRPWSPTAQQSGVSVDELFPLAFSQILPHDQQSMDALRPTANKQFKGDIYS